MPWLSARAAARIPVLRDPKHQFVEPHARVSRLLGGERSGGHSGLGVDLQKDQKVVNVVITKIASRDASTAQRGMRGDGVALGRFRDRLRYARGQMMDRPTLAILGFVVVEAGARLDFRHHQGAIVDHRDRQFQPGDVGLDHHLLAEGPGRGRQFLGRSVGAREHPEHPHGRAFGVGLDDIGRRHDVRPRRLEPIVQPPARHGHARRREHRLGLGLVHGQRRGQHPGMGIGQTEGLQHALNAAVLAPGAVQGVEADIGLQVGENRGEIAPGVDAADPGAQPVQGVGAGAARGQAHLALRRQSAHQHGDMTAGEGKRHEGS